MGIANLSVEEFQNRILGFPVEYVSDWKTWMETPEQQRANMLGVILRNWQACRPNTMRRTQDDKECRHTAPYLEDLIEKARVHLEILNKINNPFELLYKFDVRGGDIRPGYDESSTQYRAIINSLPKLWEIFKDLSYHDNGRVRGGLAGVVGISKAILLLTDGRVGPAFDSTVQQSVGRVDSCDDWIKALRRVASDIHDFEKNNETTLQDAAPQKFKTLYSGRLYDMALGPQQLKK